MKEVQTVPPKERKGRPRSTGVVGGVKVAIVLHPDMHEQLQRVAAASKRSMAAQASLWVEERLQAAAA